VKRSAALVPLVPPGVVTATSTVPADSAGSTAVTLVALFTMKVVAANLDMLSQEGTYRGLYAVGDSAIAGLREVFRRHHINAIVQGFGPMFQIYFTDRISIEDYRDYCTYVDLDRYSRFVQKLMDYGIYMTPSNGLHWIITTAHRDKDVAALLDAVDQTCAELA